MAKNSHLKDLQALGHLEVLRADLDEEGSFDDAVAGCDYAFLVAAPVNLMSENPEVRLFMAKRSHRSAKDARCTHDWTRPAQIYSVNGRKS
jgi:hypothetical protein